MVENEVWLTRKAAAIYLTRLGVPMRHEYLAKLASPENEGKGPKFTRPFWRTVRYAKSDLDAYAAKKLVKYG